MHVAEQGCSQLDDQDGFYLKTRLDMGDSLRSMAADLGRAPSTMAREAKRNGLGGGGHCDREAGRRARRRRRSQAPPPAMNKSMRVLVRCLMERHQWSPEQIAEWMRRHGIQGVPCPATIHKFIRQDRANGGSLHKHLRHGGRRRQKSASQQYGGVIPDRVGIEERPSEVDARTRVGDFEVDLIVGAGHRGAILVIVERRAGKVFAAPPKRRKAADVARAIIRLLRPHKEHVKTLTFDNGREFSLHRRVARALGCRTYFARPHHSWEKGSVENANGLLRQYFPKGMPLDEVSRREVNAAVVELNHRPRKRLGWDAPEQAFHRETNAPHRGELWYKPIGSVALGVKI